MQFKFCNLNILQLHRKYIFTLENVTKSYQTFQFLSSLGAKDGTKYDLNGFFGNSGYQGENGHQ